MQSYFILCASAFGIGVLGAIINMMVLILTGPTKASMIAHVLCAALYSIGGAGSLIFGVLWAIQHYTGLASSI